MKFDKCRRKPGTICLMMMAFILLSLTGAECEKLLTNNPNTPQEMVGNWRLVEQTGSLQDICINEVVLFQLNGIALLKCPEGMEISREFNVINNVLTYTQTSVTYNIETLNTQELFLIGTNVSRNLKYQKIITDTDIKNTNEETGSSNSSEIVK